MATKRGITPIIAIILVLMITVSTAGVMFYWISRIQHQQQGTIESSQEQLFETLSSCISIPTFRYNTIDNQTDVVFQNCGNLNHRIGDTNLIEDTVIVSTPSACSFKLNSSNCIGCPFDLEPGAVQNVVLNFTAVGACNEKVKGNIKSEITFFVDRKTSVSKTFIPDEEVICSIGIANTTPLEVTGLNTNAETSFNFTITNNGNARDTFFYTNKTGGTGGVSCGAAPKWVTIHGNSTAYPGHLQASEVASGSNQILVLNVTTDNIGASSCSTELAIRSNNCNSEIRTINTTYATA